LPQGAEEPELSAQEKAAQTERWSKAATDQVG
jgi:hypothetical protein